MTRPEKPYTFPPRRGNTLELLAGGEAFYPRMLEDIADARVEVLLGTYLWEPDATGRRFLRAAREAARRGVRVAVLLDGIGGRRVDVEDLDALRAAGAHVGVYHALRMPWFDSRLFRRNHRKLLVVDGRVAWTGGAGFGDGWAAPPPLQWWDLMARVTGPVLPSLRELFARDWKRAAREELPALEGVAARPSGDDTLHTLVTRRTRPELQRRLRLAVHGARRTVRIANAYFVPGFRLRRALRRAARRGVDVRLLLPGPRTDHFAVWTAGRRYYHRLLEAGVRIFEFQRSMLHSKYALVDDRWGYVGSSNLDNWSGRFNLELDLALLGGPGLGALDAQYEADVADAREITLEQWEARPWSLRALETLFGWIDPLL